LWGGRMTERVNPKGLSDSVALEEQIADLKQVVALMRAELADMREQRDKWQSRAERVSLTAPC
jgi:predicted  nucleic acid-binding Zn-ribbon protein